MFSAETYLKLKAALLAALSQIYTKQELAALAETWTFTLADGTTVTKKVVVLP